MGDVGERADLVRPIDGAGFRRLRERKHRGAHVMRTAPLAVERVRHGIGRDLAAYSCEPDELDAAAKEFRRAAFVHGDMRLLVAENGTPGRRQMRERERIGRSPRRNQEHRDLALEHLGEPAFDALGPGILAIGERVPLIGARDGCQDFGRKPRRVVAGEIH